MQTSNFNKSRASTSKMPNDSATADDEEHWNQSATMLSFNAMPHVKMENLNFLNSEQADDSVDDNIFEFDFRMHNNSDEILADFAALLYDSDNDIRAEAAETTEHMDASNVVNRVEPSTFLNTESIVVKQEPVAATVDIKIESVDQQPESQPPVQKKSIHSIYCDHDYLSRENTMMLLQSQEDALLVQALDNAETSMLMSSLSSTEPNVDSEAAVPQNTAPIAVTSDIANTRKVTVISEMAQPPKAEGPEDIPKKIESNQSGAISIESIIESMPNCGGTLNPNEYSTLVKELQLHAIEYTKIIRKEASFAQTTNTAVESASTVSNSIVSVADGAQMKNSGTQTDAEPVASTSVVSNNTMDERDKSDESISAMDTDGSFVFSRGHSEPLEYGSSIDTDANVEETDANHTGKCLKFTVYFRAIEEYQM